MTGIGVAALIVNGQGIPLLGFALDWGQAVGWTRALGQIVILGLALVAHLKFATHGRTWFQVAGSTVLATLLIGIPQFGDLSGSGEFSSLPRLSPLLKPPAVKLANGASVDEFLQRAEGLRQSLDQESAD
mgnify:CR=1 FL=1